MTIIVDNTGFKAWSESKSQKRKGPDTIHISKSVGSWTLGIEVNQERKLSIWASRPIGRIGKGFNNGEQAEIRLELNTIDNRVPDFVKTNPHYNPYTAPSTEKGFVEINDKQNMVTDSFKQELEFYERHWQGSSIQEINQWLCSLVPNFESLLNDQKLDEYVGNIIEEAANVVPKHKKQYVKAKYQANTSKPVETVSITEHNKLKATVDALTGVNESLRERINDLSKTENKTGLYQ